MVYSKDSNLVKSAKAIHNRILTLDCHVDIEASFITPEKPDEIGYEKFVTPEKMDAGGLKGAFFAAYIEQPPTGKEDFDSAKRCVLEKIDMIHRAVNELSDKFILAEKSEDVQSAVIKGVVKNVIFPVCHPEAKPSTVRYWAKPKDPDLHRDSSRSLP